MDTEKNETVLEQTVSRATPDLRKRSRVIYLAAIKAYLDFAGRAQRDWTRESVENWRLHLKTKKKLRAHTVNLYVRAVQYASARVAETTSLRDFAAGIPPLQLTKSSKQETPLTVAEVKRLIKTTDENRPIDLRDRALMLLGFRTGLLRGWLRLVRFEDFDSNQLTVPTRGGNSITVTVDDEAMAGVKVWMAWLANHGIDAGPIFRGLARPRESGEVLIRPKAISVDNVWLIVRERAKSCGVTADIGRSVFRDTFRAWCEKRHVPAARVKAATGLKTDHAAETDPISDSFPQLV